MTSMPQRALADTDLLVSAVGLGCNNFGRPGSATEEQGGTDRVLHAAIDHGITLLDTAEMYGYEHGRSESMMGRALAGRRDRVVIATKFGHADAKNPDLLDVPHGSRAYVRTAVEGSLRRLRTDRIDLYQVHTPDPETPIDETLSALHELVDEGKVRFLGHSNFMPAQVEEAERAATAAGHPRFVSAQNEYSLLVREADTELLPALERHRLGLLPYFPLANGLFTGKFSREGGPADSRIMRQRPHVATDAPWDAIEAFAALCADRGVGMLEGTIGWLLSRPAMASVIAGATTEQQVAQNAAAAGAWTPDAEALARIDELFPSRA
ncbi:aldo/keto reductase [Microcella humidisoli]|uniref:Aldo/keto reductase n=1 Tax=Microcella humidisoli TaxID=2963406 RepID=A0ABY5FWY1_9MICO|nr:aldo/keto reductase [Microcella humidisoli]UTT62647.1 aldo/keto reductase [Microcella humidisoli]